MATTDDNKPPNPASEVEPIKETSPTSVFVNSEPVREDQVQNAVKFLSHPKVKGSAVVYRRSFLERKGLTKEEIDEAFRRVPDPPSSVTGVQSSSTDGQIASSSSSSSGVQQQSSNHIQQHPAAAAAAPANLNQSRFNLRQTLLAVGILSASGAGAAVLFKKTIIPRLKSWIRKVVLEEDESLEKKVDPKPSLAEEAGAAAKAAANAAADVARTTQEMMASKTEERKFFNELQNMLDVQVKEIKSMNSAIKNLEGQISSRNTNSSVDSRQYSRTNGNADFDLQAAKYQSQPALAESSLTPHQKSYMEEIMDMIQNGENPDIRDINGQMLKPNSQTTLQKTPVEVGRDQNGGDHDLNVVNGGDSIPSVPWWQKKVIGSSSSSTFQTNERLIQRSSSWIPPQPPPVAMAEAAAAIRHHKNPPQSHQQQAAVIDEGVADTGSSSSNGNGMVSAEMNTIEV
ncbi:peroxisomal membrane protein PEX14-like [Impatiens glandulifera]|uniref:peroxisomal membrane protein PEX14-like n=1 Tax=Impatiens glandulifera TaxID=253017 RepID=UPI001FB0B552|nr:peroxisomal membrane protein PEX14-like [Impatiens glandulifera]